jgi:hypothetical protein
MGDGPKYAKCTAKKGENPECVIARMKPGMLNIHDNPPPKLAIT